MTIHGLSCKLIAKKGHSAEIEYNNQKMIIPGEYIPSKCQPGEPLELYFSTPELSKMKEKELARAILEEILNGGK